MNTSAQTNKTDSFLENYNKKNPGIDYSVIYRNGSGPSCIGEIFTIIEEHIRFLKGCVIQQQSEAERWRIKYEASLDELIKLEVRNAEICKITGLDGLELKKPAEVN